MAFAGGWGAREVTNNRLIDRWGHLRFWGLGEPHQLSSRCSWMRLRAAIPIGYAALRCTSNLRTSQRSTRVRFAVSA